MDLLLSKVLALFGQVFVLLLFVLLPIKVSRWVGQNGDRGKLALCCLQCFGGGALLGCFMLIQTPEIRHLLGRTLMEPRHINYPVPEAIAGAGFFLFLFIERLVAICDRRMVPRERKSIPTTESQASMLPRVEEGPSYELGLPDKEELDTPQLVRDHQVVVVVEGPTDQATGGSTRSILMLIVLSADGLFQGLAIGLKYSTPAVWNLFIAVVGHEFVVAFCLGLELVRHQKQCMVIVSGLLYACTPAVGTAIGILIFQSSSSTGDSAKIDMINGLLQSVATGVFLYVAFIGILAEELTVHTRMVKLLAVLCGYSLMAALAVLNTPAEHPSNLTNGSALPALTTPSPYT